jgi:branched-chain amino acid transport system substrate-binding protein
MTELPAPRPAARPPCQSPWAALALVALVAGAIPAARAADCSITIGVVMELTGTAGAYGQAAARAFDLAVRDINDAGGVRGCRLVTDTRDSQSQPTVAVDAANQLVQLKKVPVLVGGIISSTTLPILTSVTGPAKVLQVSPAASSPRLTDVGRDPRAGGLFLRTITSDALQGTVAARFALDQGMRRIAVIYVNNDFGTQLEREFTRVYRALGGTRVVATPYNERQGSYAAEVSTTLATNPDALYLISTPVDGATIARAWISQGGTRRLLLNDGMNSADFVSAVGARYLNEAFGTSSGTTPGASTQYFDVAFRAFAHLDPASPAADRAYDAGALVGLALAAAPRAEPAAIRAAIARVTDPRGEVIHAGRAEFTRAFATLKAGKTVRYEGVIGPVSFDAAGDITGPFRLWRIRDGAFTTVGAMTAEAVAALRTQIAAAPGARP